MRNKFHRYFQIINYLTEQNEFKGIFFLAMMLAGYGVFALGTVEKTIPSLTIIAFSFPVFIILFLLLLLFNTTNTYHNLSKNFDAYLIRFQNRRLALKETLKICILSNILVIFLFSFIFASFTFLHRFDRLFLYSELFYKGIPDYLYLVFFLARFYLFSLSLSIIWFLLIYCGKKIIAISLFFLLFVGFIITPTILEIQNNFNFNICTYFSLTRYSSFSLDITYSLLYLIVIEIIIYLLYRYSISKAGDL